MKILIHKSLDEETALTAYVNMLNKEPLPEGIAININDDDYVIEPLDIESPNILALETDDYYIMQPDLSDLH